MDLNNRRTGNDATKLRALGLLGHSDVSKGFDNKKFKGISCIWSRKVVGHMRKAVRLGKVVVTKYETESVII